MALRRTTALLSSALVLGAGCGDDDAARRAQGSPTPRVWVEESGATDVTGPAAIVAGTLRYDADNDCFLLESEGRRYPVVWPVGTSAVADGSGVEAPDGRMFAVGDVVSGVGGYLPAGSAYISAVDIPAACVPATGEVAVFNSRSTLESP